MCNLIQFCIQKTQLYIDQTKQK